MYKICGKCKNNKLLSEFSFKSVKKGLRQSNCKECHQKYSKLHYNNNKSLYFKKAIRNNKKYSERNYLIISNAKSVGCKICKENCNACLDFHHLNGKDKLDNIAHLNKYSVKYLQKEIKKCIVLCSNCHRKLHAGLITISVPNEGLEPPQP